MELVGAGTALLLRVGCSDSRATSVFSAAIKEEITLVGSGNMVSKAARGCLETSTPEATAVAVGSRPPVPLPCCIFGVYVAAQVPVSIRTVTVSKANVAIGPQVTKTDRRLESFMAFVIRRSSYAKERKENPDNKTAQRDEDSGKSVHEGCIIAKKWNVYSPISLTFQQSSRTHLHNGD